MEVYQVFPSFDLLYFILSFGRKRDYLSPLDENTPGAETILSFVERLFNSTATHTGLHPVGISSSRKRCFV